MINNQTYTIIGKNSKLEGNFNFDGHTGLLGEIAGSISIGPEYKLRIDIEADVNATIKCHDIDILGKFRGEIQSTGKVTLYPTAHFEGKIFSNKIQILPGAHVNMTGHTEENQL